MGGSSSTPKTRPPEPSSPVQDSSFTYTPIITTTSPSASLHQRQPTTSAQYRSTKYTPTTTTTTTNTTSASASLHQRQPTTPTTASQAVTNHANNYVIPAATAAREHQKLTGCYGALSSQLLVCPQYNGRGCVAEPCRRLHVCYYWATNVCRRNTCKHGHYLDSPHNQRLLKACFGRQAIKDLSEIITKEQRSSSRQEGLPQICLHNVLKRCTKEKCPKVHCSKNYLWEVQDYDVWMPMSYGQSDYLEEMYSHPSQECVDFIALKTPLPNKNLKRLANLLSKEASWTVDLEAMKLKGGLTVLNIRRLSTTSDLTSQVPVATRWLWYWQGDGNCWEPYGEGYINNRYNVALSDSLEFFLQILKRKFVRVRIGSIHYNIDGQKMTQTNQATGTVRCIRRRPACSFIKRDKVKFDELFLPLPASKKFLKLHVLPMSSEFIFVEDLLKKTLAEVKLASLHRIQNDYLWRAYQNRKCLLTSLYGGDVTATNEQYMFHGTGLDVVDLICEDNLDWKLFGTNVGYIYGSGTYFSNLASVAHQYAKTDTTGNRVMLVVLVMVGKMTKGQRDMILPPENKDTGRAYDTTCNSNTDATVFVKYHRDEYYPAYVVRYSCDTF